MPIHTPGKVLLHHIPLKFVRDKVSGGGKKSVDQSLPLVPFIDFLITLVVFLIMSFSASGELLAQKATIKMPSAANGDTMEIAPIVAIDATVVTLDGDVVADTPSLIQDAQIVPIERLVQTLTAQREQWTSLHPGDDFPGAIIIQADVEVGYRAIRKVMFSAAQAGYGDVNFAVNEGEGGN